MGIGFVGVGKDLSPTWKSRRRDGMEGYEGGRSVFSVKMMSGKGTYEEMLFVRLEGVRMGKKIQQGGFAINVTI